MAAITSGDSGIVTKPSARTNVFATGMPASATATAARPDVSNPISTLFTNPPSAALDLGSA